ncbi:MAG: sigma-70 family RNA polymerase sigma factor [Terriglobales bacterium]
MPRSAAKLQRGAGATPAATQAREVELIRRILKGENELFFELISPYQRSVYFAAYSVLNHEADAEEVAQESFLKALANLRHFRAESKFSTWLVQIAINEARMRRRKDRKGLYESTDEPRKDDEGDYIPRDFSDWREIPSESLERKEVRDALAQALASLKPIYREVFVLRDVQDLSIAETAALLGIEASSVKTRLLRARLQMRDALAPGLGGAWSMGSDPKKAKRIS